MKTTGRVSGNGVSSRGAGGREKRDSREEAQDDDAPYAEYSPSGDDSDDSEDDGAGRPLDGGAPATAVSNPKPTDVRYHTVRLSDLVVTKLGDRNGFIVADKLERFAPTPASKRFMQGLSRRTDIRGDYFKLFTPTEVFKRVIEIDGDQDLILAQDSIFALAVSKPNDPMIKLDEALAVIEGFSPTQVYYDDGEVRAEFNPTRSAGNTQIIGETYSKKFVVSIPIDGLNHPGISPMMIRQICTNGLVAEAPMFTSQIVIGKKDAGYTVERSLRAYNGDQFFTKIAERLELNKASWASVAEVMQFVKLLNVAKIHHTLSAEMIKAVWTHSGSSAYQKYLQSEGKNPKLLRKLETKLNRYDLINMVTEARTHLVGREDVKRQFDAFAGSILSRDPDLERSAEGITTASPAFFFKRPA